MSDIGCPLKVQRDMVENIEDQIEHNLSSKPSSFAVFAGAGAGKTRTLVNILLKLKNKQVKKYSLHGRKIAVITYTNAATEEISQRLKYDESFSVSTIHSFIWSLIRYYQSDIKKLLIGILEQKIKSKSKNSEYSQRLSEVISCQKFIYSPQQEVAGQSSLSHDEVIEIGACLLRDNLIFQNIVVDSYPIIFIDECQDTHKQLIASFISLAEKFDRQFTLGLFGDMMQQIFSQGMEGLDKALPANFQIFKKTENYRSLSRIVELGNRLRSDEIKQRPMLIQSEGTVRVFVVQNGNVNQEKKEQEIALRMVKESGDTDWGNHYECLVLEHQMAARRMKFQNFFMPLFTQKSLKPSLRVGTIPFFSILVNAIFPLKEAMQSENEWQTLKIVKQYSPLFDLPNDVTSIQKYRDAVKKVKELLCQLKNLFNQKDVTLRQIFGFIASTTLFKLSDQKIVEALSGKNVIDLSSEQSAILASLEAPLIEYERYRDYVNKKSRFFTHHGVKGLEFDRVMVVVDSENTNNKSLNYERLIKKQSKFQNNLLKRLFYVVCSRARKSLAVVIYCDDVDSMKNSLNELGWFRDNEVVLMR